MTHIVGLRPFMSQPLCEQVVGRGLRRSSYQIGQNDLMTEEVAKVFGVPFQADFIARLKTAPVEHLILETKGFDELAEVKAAAAERWVAAVNADGQHGRWACALARSVGAVRDLLDKHV